MNKGELRSHFLALLNRSDCTDALADTFISQAIGRIRRTLRIPSMERQQTYAIDSPAGVASIVIPIDLLEIIDIHYQGTALVRLPSREMFNLQQSGETGQPRFFTRVQGSLQISPKPTTGIVYLNYYGEGDALSADSDTNDLTLVGADAITYTALAYSSDYFLDERGPLFDQKSSIFVSEIQEQANGAEQSGASQVIRPSQTFVD